MLEEQHMPAKQIPITIAARLIYHLGEQLISDEFVALLELIKNSYDADATKCVVTINSHAETSHGMGSIVIQDNGNGMLPHTVVNDFLRLATNYKKVNKVSPFYKRRALGEKGLGRLSYQRLGKYVMVRTVPRIERLKESVQPEDKAYLESQNTNCIDITMNWDGFSDTDDISDVFATVEETYVPNASKGTEIIIEGIRNPNFWILNTEKRIRLQNEILALINPFVESKSKGAFYLTLDINGEKFLIDSINEEIVDKLSDVSSHFSFDGRTLTLTAEFKKKYIDRQKEQYLSTWKKKDFDVVEDNFDSSLFEKREFIVDLSSESAWEKECQLPEHSVSMLHGSPAIDFVFDGSFYMVDKSNANRTEIDKNILTENLYVQRNFQRIGQIWDRISGVYVYRDQFRILPYGSNDWLGFTARSQKGKATILKQGNVTGYIHIVGEKSETIQEQTNRQGILEDEYGSNFLLILNNIITEQLFCWDKLLRGQFTRPKEDNNTHLLWNSNNTIAFKNRESAEKDYEIAEKKLIRTISDAQSTSDQISFFDMESMKKQVGELTEDAETLRKATNEVKKDLTQKMALISSKLSEFEEIVPLLGQTMIIETTTHELSRIYARLAASSSELSTYTRQLCEPASKLNRIVLELNGEVSELDLQLNHLLPTQRNKLKDIQSIDMKAFLGEQYVGDGAVSKRLAKKDISCKVTGDSFLVQASQGNMIVIFDNLVINAEYWLDKDEIKERDIFFNCLSPSTVQVWDSGLGIAQEIENVLFEPFQTMKRGGRGLGLYIVQELLSIMNASIELLQERNSFGNRYKFQITFQESTS